jgi:hypothetical protein
VRKYVRDLLAFAIDCRAAPRRAQEHLAECETILRLETFGVGLKISSKLRLAGLRDRRVFREKLHLLSNATSDYDVVAVEAGCPAFAVKNFIANIVVDEALQFIFTRPALPRTGEAIGQIGNPRRRNNDSIGLFSFSAIEEMKKTKQSRAQHEKLEQGLFQQREFQDAYHMKASDQGVYQIGDV